MQNKKIISVKNSNPDRLIKDPDERLLKETLVHIKQQLRSATCQKVRRYYKTMFNITAVAYLTDNIGGDTCPAKKTH